jgi:hypothetical protein
MVSAGPLSAWPRIERRPFHTRHAATHHSIGTAPWPLWHLAAAGACRPGTDTALSLHAFAARRHALPAPANLLRIWRGGADAVWIVGGGMDDLGAAVPMSSVRNAWSRPRSRSPVRTCSVVPAVAIRPLARHLRCDSWHRRLAAAMTLDPSDCSRDASAGLVPRGLRGKEDRCPGQSL